MKTMTVTLAVHLLHIYATGLQDIDLDNIHPEDLYFAHTRINNSDMYTFLGYQDVEIEIPDSEQIILNRLDSLEEQEQIHRTTFQQLQNAIKTEREALLMLKGPSSDEDTDS